MAQIILFRPQEEYSTKLNFRCSLGLLYIASFVAERGYTVKIIDPQTCQDWCYELKNSVDGSTICAGVSVMTGYQIKGALHFAKALKKIKQIPVIWGGLHPSILPFQTLKNELVDIVVIGEGEEAFFQIVNNLKQDKGRSLDSIDGVIFKQNGNLISNQLEKKSLNLDSLPIPHYDLIDFRYYSNCRRDFMLKTKGVLDINTDRGCPYRCAFCYNINFNKRHYRGMSAERVLEITEKIKELYNVDAINFVADNFFVNKNRIRAICEGLIDKGINIEWHSDMRIDTFLNYEGELIKLMKNSGCTTLTFGIESGSDRILDLIQKDIRVDDVIKAHKKAKDFGFRTLYHFMIGFPEETKEDIEATLRLIRFLGRVKNAAFLGPAIYVPYPGTPLYDRCLELGFIPPERLEDWIEYDWDSCPKLPWFSKKFKNYIIEAQFVTSRAYTGLTRQSIFRKLFSFWCKLRLIGFIYKVRLYNIDSKLIWIFKKILIAIKGLTNPL